MRSVPASKDSTSTCALSLSMTQTVSPLRTLSPSFLSHSTRMPSSVDQPRRGMTISWGMSAVDDTTRFQAVASLGASSGPLAAAGARRNDGQVRPTRSRDPTRAGGSARPGPAGAQERRMKPFVVNRYGRIVFPFNFFPELDFSVFQSLDQFAAVIRRDFEEKAPTETDIVARVEGHGYATRYELLRDLALNLFWVNRYAMTMYRKQPTRWRDVPRSHDDVFLPVFRPWDGGELVTAIEAGYRALPPTWDEGTETKVFTTLLDIFRHKKGAGAELPALKPTVAEILANPKN